MYGLFQSSVMEVLGALEWIKDFLGRYYPCAGNDSWKKLVCFVEFFWEFGWYCCWKSKAGHGIDDESCVLFSEGRYSEDEKHMMTGAIHFQSSVCRSPRARMSYRGTCTFEIDAWCLTFEWVTLFTVTRIALFLRVLRTSQVFSVCYLRIPVITRHLKI